MDRTQLLKGSHSVNLTNIEFNTAWLIFVMRKLTIRSVLPHSVLFCSVLSCSHVITPQSLLNSSALIRSTAVTITAIIPSLALAAVGVKEAGSPLPTGDRIDRQTFNALL